MGVPKFYSKWLARKMRIHRATGVHVKLPKEGVNSLAFDVNGIIHKARAIVYGLEEDTLPGYKEFADKMKPSVKERRVMATACKLIADATLTIRPLNMVYIAVDGPVNRAKMSQQRGRRYASASTEYADSPDSCAITPGTLFMQKFHVYLTKWLEVNRQYFPQHLIYSSHLVDGEGEHKIMSAYRRKVISGKGHHVLYGLDADLIMLSMVSPCENILLIRENLREVISINGLKQFIISLVPEPLKPTVIHDFVAMISLIGNDFLPHSHLFDSMFERVEAILNAYISQRKPLTTMLKSGIRVIEYSVLTPIINALGNADVKATSIEAITRFAQPENYMPSRFYDAAIVDVPGTTYTKKVFDWERFRSAWYNNELYASNMSDGMPIPGMDAPIVATPDGIEHMCTSYLEGIAWVFRYYQTVNVDSYWVYPYHHCPLMKDMAVVAQNLEYEYGKNVNQRFAVKFGPDTFRHGALEQLLMVIPDSNKKDNVPKALHSAYHRTLKNPLVYMHPIAFVIEDDGVDKNETFLSTPIVPTADLEDAIRYVEAIRKSGEYDKTLELFKPHTTIEIPSNDRDLVMYDLVSQMMSNRYHMDMESEALKYQRYQRGRGGRGERGGRGRGGRGDRGRGRGGRDEGRGRGRGERGGRGRGGRDDRGRGRGGDRKGSDFISGGTSTDISKLSIHKLNANNGPFLLIQDSVLKYGTKMRLLPYFTKIASDGVKEVVTSGTTHGYGQAAVAWCCKEAGLKCVLFVNKNVIRGEYKPTYMTKEAKAMGAEVHEIETPGKETRMSELSKLVDEYYKKQPAGVCVQLPPGLYSPGTRQALSNNIMSMGAMYEMNPKRIWVAGGTGMVAGSIGAAFPDAEILIVEVGFKVWNDTIAGIKHRTFRYPPELGSFKTPTVDPPPYESVPSYDAKVWHFVMKYGQPGDVIWNIK